MTAGLTSFSPGSWRVGALCALAVVGVGAAAADTPLATVRVASGLVQPTFVTAATGDYSRMFILEKAGRVRVMRDGVLLATPFLDIDALVTTSLEWGLLGMTFHPDFANNGWIYLSYNDNGGHSVIARWTVSATNPDRADPASRQQVLFINQPSANHRGGWLQFGIDGYLYASFGDGGGQNDPSNRAQNLDLLQGKILRLDVDGDDFPADSGRNYAIPPDNPFVGVAGADEIWAYGLRNPWRCSFDRLTYDLWIGDVGQNAREEIDFEPHGSSGGRNYGWRCTEGTFCTGLSGCTCNGPTLTPPIFELTRAQSTSVIGGYVYRGCAIPDLQGAYFFADWTNKIWTLRYNGTTVSAFTDRRTELDPPGAATIGLPSSFGEDAAGELYICDHNDGEIYKIVPNGVPPQQCPCPADLNDDRRVDLSDLARLLSNFGRSGDATFADGDVDTDQDVDLSDLASLLTVFGAVCPP